MRSKTPEKDALPVTWPAPGAQGQQVQHPQPVDRPPPTNLPAQPTPLIGRDQEVAEAVALLRGAVRLLTLTGAGGTGKTRLSLAVAAEMLDAFVDGIYFVDLAPVRDPGLVIATIAQTLGVMEVGGQPLLAALQRYLRERVLLLLLDNFEHVEPAAPFIAQLLAAAPGLKLLITSRSVLHLAGEHDFPVPPLALPDLVGLTPVEDLAQNAAVALFVQRARAAHAGFQLTDKNARTVAELCCRLDGLPLAIELAAARCKLLSPQALLARLISPLQALTGGPRDLPARQQTLRATIDWSYNLLEADEQTLFRRLAIFVGGCTLDAVEAVCAMDEGPSGQTPFVVLDRLAALVDHSLLRQEEVEDEPRFRMLETIREYALERLAASGEAPILRDLHAYFFLALAEEAEPKLTSSEQLRWLACLERDHDNLRAALTATKTMANGVEVGLRLAAALWWLWSLRGYVSEGRAWLESLLVQTATEMPSSSLLPIRATALHRAAGLANAQDDYRRAMALGEESLALCRTLNDVRGMAWAHYTLGVTAMFQGEYGRAQMRYQEALVLFRALGDTRGIGWTLNELGSLRMMDGDYAQAAIFHAESLAVAHSVGNLRDIAIHLVKRAMLAQAEGKYAQTEADLEESLVLFRKLGDRQMIPLALHSLAYVAQLQSDYERAQTLFREGLRLYETIGGRFGIARCLVGLAAVAEAAGQFSQAARLFGAAAAQHDNLKAFLEPDERAYYERSLDTVHRQLGKEAFAAAWEQGRVMTPAQALAGQEPGDRLAPAVTAPPPTTRVASAPPAPGADIPAGLSERELEVLRLLARGLSYVEIADQLVISPRTVNRHLTSIYTKLNVASRHAATRFALDHGLI